MVPKPVSVGLLEPVTVPLIVGLAIVPPDTLRPLTAVAFKLPPLTAPPEKLPALKVPPEIEALLMAPAVIVPVPLLPTVRLPATVRIVAPAFWLKIELPRV